MILSSGLKLTNRGFRSGRFFVGLWPAYASLNLILFFFYYDILNRNVYMVIIMYVCSPWADITHVMCVSISVTTCYHFECKTV